MEDENKTKNGKKNGSQMWSSYVVIVTLHKTSSHRVRNRLWRLKERLNEGMLRLQSNEERIIFN